MPEAATARSASAFARCTRERWCGEAPSGVSHRKRSAPARSAARSSRRAARPSISSIVARGWSRSVAGEVDDGRCTPRSAWRHDAGIGQVADRELHPHPLGAEPPRIAHEAAHVLAARRQAAQHGRADQPGGACEQQHAREA